MDARASGQGRCWWAPALDDSWGPGGAQTVATVSHDSCLSLWDLRDVWEPNLTAMSTKTTWATSCVWPLDTASVWSCYTDGRLKLASLGHGNIRHRIPFETPNPNQALWNMAVSPAHPELCAACGDGGTVVVASNLRDVAHDLADKSNHRLRVHLPLLLPRIAGHNTKRLGITVGGAWREWEEGRCLVLDDSFMHSVDLRSSSSSTSTSSDRTSSSATRLLLVCDVRHPDAGFLYERAYGGRAASS